MENGYSMCFNEWALDKDIKNELGLLLIISSLCAEKGYCFASNEYFAKLFETNDTTISRKIKLLESKGYINITYDKKGCEIKNREIRLSKMITHDYQKEQSSIIKNDKDNNISFSNNINKENNISKDILKEIVDYLNLKTHKSYKLNSKDTQKHINARLNDGFTIEDFKKVIDNKSNKWLDSDMEQYLRPSTLFGSKFESYLNEKVNKQPKKETEEEWEERMEREIKEMEENERKRN